MILKILKVRPILKNFFIPRSLKTTRNNRSSPHIGPIKKNFPKSYYFCITNNETVQNSKSKPKKLSFFLCTFKACLFISIPILYAIYTYSTLAKRQSKPTISVHLKIC